MSGSIQLKHLDSAFAAPAIEQRLSNFPGRNVSKRLSNLIGIENARMRRCAHRKE